MARQLLLGCRQQSASRPQEGHCLARHHQQLTIKQPIIALLTSQINSLPDSKKFYRSWDPVWWTIIVNRAYNYNYFCCLPLASSSRKKIDVFPWPGWSDLLCSKGNLLFVWLVFYNLGIIHKYDMLCIHIIWQDREL